MVLMAGTELPLRAIREQVASALDLVVHVERLNDGSRKVVRISEVQGMEGDIVLLQDLFQFQQSGYEKRKILGKHVSLGIRPRFLSKLELRNVHLPAAAFAIEAPR
jgi:pilus assembly protein CpaF